jgi:hypothetical protein
MRVLARNRGGPRAVHRYAAPAVSVLKRVLIALGIVVLGLVGFIWWKLRPRVEEIPEVLPELSQESKPLELTLPAQSELPAFKLGEQSGKTVFFVVDGRESMEAGEGRLLKRALDRWAFPESVVGIDVGHAEGFGLLGGQIQGFLDMIRPEARRPIYADFDGAVMRTFEMPLGHTALIVIGPDGAVKYRKSGDMTEAEVEELRGILGASEPAPGGPAPAFTVGELTLDACKPKGCAIVFLDQPIAKADVPELAEEGFGNDMKAAFDAIGKPGIRLVHRFAAQYEITADVLPGAVVGKLTDISFPGWSVVDEQLEAREAFGIPKGEAGLVVIDGEGRLAFAEHGRIPFWKLRGAGQAVGLTEPKREGGRGGPGGGPPKG